MHSINSKMLVVLLTIPLVLHAPFAALAGPMGCGEAMQQVNSYAHRVRAFADFEYYRGIPMRCHGDWKCGYWWIHRLNGWYGHQMGLMQSWRQSITVQCKARPARPNHAPSPTAPPPVLISGRGGDLGSGGDGSVEISIPTTPLGYSQ